MLCVFACATPTMYESWGQQLLELQKVNGRVQDVSLILGTPPYRCEPVTEANLEIGVLLNDKRLVISVLPNGPADEAGVQRGDTIESVAGKVTRASSDVVTEIRENARPEAPLEVRTNRGVHQVFPRTIKGEQCYWEVHAGEIHRAGGAAYVNPYGGSAGASSAEYQRFFRASCRITEGYVAGCRANWQQ
jgi:hypothetical protein